MAEGGWKRRIWKGLNQERKEGLGSRLRGRSGVESDSEKKNTDSEALTQEAFQPAVLSLKVSHSELP